MRKYADAKILSLSTVVAVEGAKVNEATATNTSCPQHQSWDDPPSLSGSF